MADTQNETKADPSKALATAQAADQKAIDAQAKADDATKSKEQLAADKAKAEADKAHAEAAHASAQTVVTDPMTVRDAKVHAMVPDDMGAGDHLAQQFSNDPANPKPALPEHSDPDLCTVKLSRVTPDSPVPVYTVCHPDMVGDYLRAGWNRD